MKDESKADDENDADDEGNAVESKTPATIMEDEDKVGELADPESGNVIHKKRRRKNVESRDV
jgi:hypothetical protein